jgi:hypothetical protein
MNKQSCFTPCSAETHTELKILNPRILELIWLQRRKNRRKVKVAPPGLGNGRGLWEWWKVLNNGERVAPVKRRGM